MKGFAILTVVFIMVAFAILGTAAVALVTGGAQMMSDEFHSQRAFDVAQAGLEYTALQLGNDADWSDNSGATMNFSPGSFTTTFTAQTSDAATVKSTGTVAGVTRSVQQDFEGGVEAFQNAIYTEQEVIVSGSSTGDVYGPVNAGDDVDENQGVIFHDAIEENNVDASVPTPDWAYWQGIADHIIGGSRRFNAGTYSGIYYIGGETTFRSNVTLSGTIICRGRVTINNVSNITISATAPNPAVFAGDRITINGSSGVNITGWVLSLEDIRLTDNTGVTAVGGFSSVGDVIFSGNFEADVTYDETYAPQSDSITGGERSGVTVSNWTETF